MQFKLLLSTLSLPLFLGGSLAATCTAEDQTFWDQTGPNLMWSLRQYACGNVWWENIKVVPTNSWCLSGGGICYNGWWYMHNHPSQQRCWDILEEIINQCMWFKFFSDNSIHSTNGGYWSLGSEYSEGWFYTVNNKRSIDEEPHNNVTLASGETVTADRAVYLSFDEHGNLTGIAHDIMKQNDGTYKDMAA